MASFFTAIEPIKPMVFSEGKVVKAENDGTAVPFAGMLKDAISDYESLQELTGQDSLALAAGNADNLAQIQINSMKEQAALQTVVQLSSRVVNAYKDIMQMQI